jgi:putative transposase
MGLHRSRGSHAFRAKLHAKVANYRDTYLHQVSAKLIRTNDIVVIEKLSIRNLCRGRFERYFLDASWGKLVFMLSYKAEGAGRKLIEVDPRNTSQACSGCGTIVPKDLSVRMHNCPHCGLSLDRDHNAAINILNRGVMRPGFAKPLCVAA